MAYLSFAAPLIARQAAPLTAEHVTALPFFAYSARNLIAESPMVRPGVDNDVGVSALDDEPLPN